MNGGDTRSTRSTRSTYDEYEDYEEYQRFVKAATKKMIILRVLEKTKILFYVGVQGVPCHSMI